VESEGSGNGGEEFEEFGQGPWVEMLQDLDLNGRVCLGGWCEMAVYDWLCFLLARKCLKYYVSKVSEMLLSSGGLNQEVVGIIFIICAYMDSGVPYSYPNQPDSGVYRYHEY